jgi:transcriptional regulator with GAF, ATPase, and Fis domain
MHVRGLVLVTEDDQRILRTVVRGPWVERQTIARALEAAGGVKKDAATILGISQRALSYYLAKYRFADPAAVPTP